LAALHPTRLRRVAIVPASGGVEVRALVRAVLPTWELLVAGETFYFRSADLRLPPVVSVAARQAGFPTSNASGRPPHARPRSVDGTRRALRGIARASHARSFALSVTRPDALAIALRVRVRNAARFLRDRLRGLVIHARRHERRYVGLYIEVDDDWGVAWADGETGLGGLSTVRPQLAGCDPFPPPGPGPGPPPPCPA
jgi:hypothetical protein